MGRKIEDNSRFLAFQPERGQTGLATDTAEPGSSVRQWGRLSIGTDLTVISRVAGVALPTYPFQRKRYWINTEFLSKGGDGLSRQQNAEQILRQQGSVRQIYQGRNTINARDTGCPV